MTEASPDKLLSAYRATAIRYRRALEHGTPAESNRAFDELAEIRRALHAPGHDHAQRLRGFLDDDDIAVRMCAAVDALSFAPDDGVRVLRELAAGPRGLLRHDADMVLSLWDAGEWKGTL